MMKETSKPKKIGKSDITGALGVNIVERRVLEMGFLWYPSGGVEAGIDGRLEIRTNTGEVTNLIVSVQSKATDGAFQHETETDFSFQCTGRDLQYWLGGNLPVIVVCSRPRTNEAYWLSVRDYFADPNRKATQTLRFSKSKNRFDQSAADALIQLALPSDGGLYLGAQPKTEILYTDLAPIDHFPSRFYTARTTLPTKKSALRMLYDASPNDHVLRGFVIHEGVVYSFRDLSASRWKLLIDEGTVESHQTFEWSMQTEQAKQNLFVELLNGTLQDQLGEDDIQYSNLHGFYFHRASDDLGDRRRKYKSRRKAASREVFKRYQSKLDPERTAYFRHAAFIGAFVQLDGNWFLQITPTYRFTNDGHHDSRYSADALSGIKRLELNQAVHGQVVMWGEFLRNDTLFSQNNLLKFLPLMRFHVDSGFEDEDWLKREDAEKQAILEEDDDEQGVLDL